MAFVDRLTIYVQAGDGGSGCRSFRREKYVPRGGPDGGDVIVRAVAGTDSLAEIVNRKHWRADSGGRGRDGWPVVRRECPFPLPVAVFVVVAAPRGVRKGNPWGMLRGVSGAEASGAA